MSTRSLIVGILIFISGCTATVVKKDPGPRDKGIRYYRPKPYLLIQPSATNPTTMVTISLQYLPDFSEEYSINVRAGMGVNTTNITLQDGWNLTSINQTLDSKTADNVNAFSNLIKAVTPLAQKTADTPPAPTDHWEVAANNIPFGYYESVVSRDLNCVKRLYGWRYVGFAPFNACPMEMCGSDGGSCDSVCIYGLRMEQGVMTFKPLVEIPSTTDMDLVLVSGSPRPTSAKAAQEFINSNNPKLVTAAQAALKKEVANATVNPADVSFAPGATADQIDCTIKYSAQAGPADEGNAKKNISTSLAKTANELGAPYAFNITLKKQ